MENPIIAPASLNKRIAAVCSRCGGTRRTSHGVCVNCFLKEGLEAEAEDSAEVFEHQLAEDEIPEKPWRLGNYEIVKELGRGGMGAVYLARRADAQYEKHVAIKLIKRGMDTDSVLRHFRDERQILAGFDHPNIARLFDAGTTPDGLPYFVMEYIEGLPLDQYCDKQRLSITDRLKLFREVCSAVSYAHRHLVIHRDIKRSNILVTPEGAPKLLDFGIAKVLQAGAAPEALVTSTGLRLMTPEYASPEQVRGQPVTTASDVYSLGVVLYELLAGRSPYHFAVHSPRDLERAITEREPTRPSTAVSSRLLGPRSFDSRLLRGDLDNIVLMALRKEPERRYQSVDRFSEDIGRYLESRPVLARQDTFAYRAGKFIGRNKIGVAIAVATTLALLAGTMAVAWEAHVARVEKATAERRLEDVRKLSHRMLFDYSDSIKGVVGGVPLREKMAGDAMEYLDRLSKEAAGDYSLQRELAAAYEKVADVQGGPAGVSPSRGGTIAASIESYRKALRIRETVAAANPMSISARDELANSYRNLSLLLWHANDTAGGLESGLKALSLREQLAAAKPADLDAQVNVVQSCRDIGQMFEEQGNFRKAMANLTRAKTLAETIAAAAPDRADYKGLLARVYLTTFYDMVQNAQDVEGALQMGQTTLRIYDKLSADHPAAFVYRQNKAVAFHFLGIGQLELSDLTAALQSFRNQLEVLGSPDPTNAWSREPLASGLLYMAITLDKLGKTADGLEDAREAVRIRQEAASADPTNSWSRSSLIEAIAQTARLSARTGNAKETLEDCQRAQTLLDDKVDDPTNVSLKACRANAYGDLAEAYTFLASDENILFDQSRDRWTMARQLYQQALDMWLQLRNKGTLPGYLAGKPDEIGREIVRCDAALAAR